MTIVRPLRTGIVRDIRFLDHITADGHPENPGRLLSIHAALEDLMNKTRLAEIKPRRAEFAEIELVHSADYLRALAATAGKEQCALTPDTFTSAESFETVLLAAGGMCEMIARVVFGELDNGFVLLRPPGHHAERNRAMGYCLINNIALGAMFARRYLGLNRILIVDWDVHHGNGTQHIFEDDPSVLFFSVHQYPHFPGTGVFTEIGRGPGEGYTVNIPLPKGLGDLEYRMIFETILNPLALEFEPDLILVSAGFDTHREDPLGGMRMTPLGFAGLTQFLMRLAEQCCRGRLVLGLEGGYNLSVLGNCVRAVILELSGSTITHLPEPSSKKHRKQIARAVSRCFHVHRRFWKTIQP